MEADHAGRLHIGTINREFLSAGGSVAEYGAAVKAAIDRDLIKLDPSGGYLSFYAGRRGYVCVEKKSPAAKGDHGAGRVYGRILRCISAAE
jgi:hypothetical protein